jgi:glycosyl transferase family 9 (putative heptosyltransferase)
MHDRRIQASGSTCSHSSVWGACQRNSLEPAIGLGKEWPTWLDARYRREPLAAGRFGLKILVLRGGALGDLILTLPVLRELRKGFSNCNLELWGIFPQARLLTPEFVHRVERLDAAELVPLFVDGPLPQLVQNKLDGFELAISFLSDPDGVVGRNLAAAGVRRVISCATRMRPEVHAVFQLAEVLGQLGLSLHDPIPRLEVGSKPAHSSTLGFHVGSGSPQKNWPIDRWIELIQRLESVFSDFLLVGGEADDKVVCEFLARCRVRPLTTLLNQSLADLGQALSRCAVFVGHDTGVTHFAAAVGTPTVALFGPTDPSVWAPLGEHVSVVRSPDGTMASIRPEEVEEEAYRRWGKRVGVSA